MKEITASLIQGSGIEPAAYVVTASDLRVATPGNRLIKFADDTYLIIAASNVDSRSDEINNVKTWALANNLTLNRNKTKEIVFVEKLRKRQVELPLKLTEIVRVTSLKVLGVA